MEIEPRLVECTAADATAAALFAAQEREVMRRYGEDDPGPSPGATDPTVLLYLGEDAVGCVVMAPGEEFGEIKRMFLDESARGKGYSRLLLNAAEDLARREGVTTLRLETGTEQPEAMGLYARSGYTPIPGYGYWKHDPAVRCFEKQLEHV
ncbi:GNAT family N-acetyltransferase [Herbiconiux daphne]|uniref:GNAT family N-acetyltransferase n=1 Tax=Herbiconiux daphne TaxID=2970914 RepID=A0ABT2GWL9_9MICO|nr:GNAT family N-acetyltransferase [Herbiconiux daphne]MCS5732301.1 GNAT family N-acetyltransferase [Herbiconiux daphne]